MSYRSAKAEAFQFGGVAGQTVLVDHDHRVPSAGPEIGRHTGLSFTGLALTDATYRAAFDSRVVADVERIMAVRSVYLALNDGGGADPGQQ